MKEITMPEEKSVERFFVKIRAGTIKALNDLQKVWDLDVFRHTAQELTGEFFEVQGMLTDVEIGEIQSQGYEVEVLSDADEVARQRMKELQRKDDE